jgi:hypothetical protein
MKLDSKQYNSGLLKMDVCPSQQPKYGKWRSHPRFTRNIIIHRTLSTNLPSNKPQPSIMHSGEQEQTPTSFQIIENPKYMRSKKAGSVNYLNIIWNAVATAARVGFKGSMVGCEGSMVGCDGCEGNMVGCDGFKSGIGRLRRLRGWNYRLRQLNSLCPMVAIDFHNCGSHVAPLKARFRNVGCNNWTDFAQKSVSKKKKSNHRSLTFIRECSWSYELIPTSSSTSSDMDGWNEFTAGPCRMCSYEKVWR